MHKHDTIGSKATAKESDISESDLSDSDAEEIQTQIKEATQTKMATSTHAKGKRAMFKRKNAKYADESDKHSNNTAS